MTLKFLLTYSGFRENRALRNYLKLDFVLGKFYVVGVIKFHSCP